jgi:hypothetical protein
MFPDYRQGARTYVNVQGYGAVSPIAHVLLPQPPQDVVEVILKADKASVKMHVAAVAEAIGFRETLPELREGTIKHNADEAGRIRRLMEEPFIYTNEGTATAILAQFGEFPIEKEVVDMVVAGDRFLPEDVPVEVSPVGYGGGGGAFDDYARRAILEAQRSMLVGERIRLGGRF